MTKFEYGREIMALYTSAYKLTEFWYEGSRLLFHEVMENNDIACTVIHFEYDGNDQMGRYVIPFDDDFFVMNITNNHRRNNFDWSIEE